MLRLGSQPTANAGIDEADDVAIQGLVDMFAEQFPSTLDGTTEMGAHTSRRRNRKNPTDFQQHICEMLICPDKLRTDRIKPHLAFVAAVYIIYSYNAYTHTGIPAIPPTKLHSLGVRDTSYGGHSFDTFYYHFGVQGFEVELGIAENVAMSGACCRTQLHPLLVFFNFPDVRPEPVLAKRCFSIAL